MNYKVIKLKDKLYKIQEISTNIVYNTQFNDYESARRLRDHLNKGGGFAGFTPEFFIWK